MDVSILKLRPAAGNGIRPIVCFSLIGLLMLAELGFPRQAEGFSLVRFSTSSTVRLDPDDILQGGATLGGASEQSIGQGSFPLELNDFGQPLDVNIAGSFGGGATMSTRLVSNFAFGIRLSRQERDACLNDADFNIQLTTVNPAGGVSSSQGSGSLEVMNFQPTYRGAFGRRCPSVMFYGFTLDLDLQGAISAGSYTATTEISVDQAGPGGGAPQILQSSLEVVMPSFLLLYHPDSLDVNLRTSAIAGLLGAASSCGSDGCLDLGQRSLTLTTPGQPVSAGLSGAVGPVATVQTVTLRNAVGARATGCSGDTYSSADYQIVGATGGIRPGSGVVSGLASQACGLDLRTGDISFDLDLAQAAGESGSATIQITVTGI